MNKENSKLIPQAAGQSSKVIISFIIVSILVIGVVIGKNFLPVQSVQNNVAGKNRQGEETKNSLNPLSIEYLRNQEYPRSDIVIEQTLSPASNYDKYIASYKSDSLKIYALLTIPKGELPPSGWPVIIFNHGYIPPEQYRTTERYVAYVDAFARNGYIVFKPDFRGNGDSEGKPAGAYYSPAYTIDILNALSSIKRFKEANPERIGIWGHSMGGNLTLRAMVVSSDVKVGVIWAGVVGTYEELLTKWHRRNSWTPSEREVEGHITSIRQNLLDKYGTPENNPQFWQSIDPRFFLSDISGPLQLHQGLSDEEVPPLFSESLTTDLKKLSKTVELYTYEEADHNISGSSFNLAMQRSVDFFNKYLKGGGKE